MSRSATELLKPFEALDLGDKQAFAVEILRRTRALPFDSGQLTDKEGWGNGPCSLGLLGKRRGCLPNAGSYISGQLCCQQERRKIGLDGRRVADPSSQFA